MKIHCDNFEEWTRTIIELGKSGLRFEAFGPEASKSGYLIELSGGY